MATPPLLAVGIPCYNEQEALPLSLPALQRTLRSMIAGGLAAPGSYIIACDDGSRDATWPLLCDAAACAEPAGSVRAIRLGCNYGHQQALAAIIDAARGRCDALITIDADMQTPFEAIPRMLEAMEMEKADIVYGVRADRSSDSLLKRATARGYYRLQRALGADIEFDHADFRLLSARALDRLDSFGERTVYWRGLVKQLGLPEAIVTYKRAPRAAGTSKYSPARMLNLGIDGVTSLTARPMRLIFFTGLASLVADLGVAIYAAVSYWRGTTALGWMSVILSVWLWGSLLMMALGIVGEYVGKIFTEVKGRPRYSAIETAGFPADDISL